MAAVLLPNKARDYSPGVGLTKTLVFASLATPAGRKQIMTVKTG